MDMSSYRLIPMGDTGLKLWAPADQRISHDGIRDDGLTPAEKINRDKLDKVLTEKAEVKADICWDCDRKASSWVREVQYDVMEGDASIDHAKVSSAAYTGPVPGFCFGCIGHAPAKLARAVYFDRMEMQWGFRPTRWFVIFTDGTKQGGSCLQIDPVQTSPQVIDTHIGSDDGS